MLQPLSFPDVTQGICSTDREFQHRTYFMLFTQHWLG
jgi:hypothetical protein